MVLHPIGFPIAHVARRCTLAALAAAMVLCLGQPAKAVQDSVDVWPVLKEQVFGDRTISEEDGMVILEAPETAHDAATVPLTVRIPATVQGKLKSLTMFIDQNPDPKVATLTFGPAGGTGGERYFNTRVRFERFSFVRAVLETEDGSLHMATRFVRAAGGCAAMNAKDPDAENEGLGTMRVKSIPPDLKTDPVWTAQVMLKHPNSNGLQLDIDTGGYIPARYVKEMTVKRDGELVFKMDGTFSISANPNFRFTFGRGEQNALDVRIVDTDDTVFEGQSAPKGS